jgi:CBS domain-containing protein
MEQILLTDQDNALVFADEGEARREWFQRLAERVNGDLEAAGFPRCPGGYMARSWNGTLSEWTRRFAGWLDAPSPQALLESSIFFDVRRVAGHLDVDALDVVMSQAPKKPAFLRFLAKAAMEFKPPPSLLLRLKGESSTVDLKAHGISPVVFLARCYGLECGSRSRNTFERLEDAGKAGLMDDEVWPPVLDAYRFLLGLRLRLQLRAVTVGEQATNKIALRALTAIERSRLKDSFRAIRAWQDRAALHFKIEF